MTKEPDSKRLKLPERKEITLCEAVTAFVHGKSSDVMEYVIDGEVETEEQRAREKDLIEHLQSAAYAGRIKFRALRNGDDPVDGHKDIDHLYFSEKRGLRWYRDEIWSRPSTKSKPVPPRFTKDWYDVHIDRIEFESLARELGGSFQPSPNADAPDKQMIFKTGMPGRPTSKHLILKIAQDRLDAGARPDSLTAFSKQLAKDLVSEFPGATPVTAKTVMNAVRELYNSHKAPPKTIYPS